MATSERYAAWKAGMEGAHYRGKIKTPLLLVSALDDPLHHPDCIGLQEGPSSPNVALLLTETGGHVAWPGKGGRFDFIPTVVHDFCNHAAQHAAR